jgi:hypothetical protein
MAAGAIVRVLANLIGKHGLARGVKMAQGLGFKNKEIQGAVSKLTKGVTKKPKGTFAQRKAARTEDMYYRDFVREQRKAQSKYASEHFNRFGQEVDDILW